MWHIQKQFNNSNYIPDQWKINTNQYNHVTVTTEAAKQKYQLKKQTQKGQNNQGTSFYTHNYSFAAYKTIPCIEVYFSGFML